MKQTKRQTTERSATANYGAVPEAACSSGGSCASSSGIGSENKVNTPKRLNVYQNVEIDARRKKGNTADGTSMTPSKTSNKPSRQKKANAKGHVRKLSDVDQDSSSSDEDTTSALEKGNSHGPFTKKSKSIDEAVELLGYGNFQRIALLACGLCFIADAMELTLLGFLAMVLQYEWGLSGTQTASISAAVFAGEALGSLALGYIGDKFGRKPAFLTASIIICVGGLVSCVCQTYEQLLFVRFIVGCGVGGVTVPYDIFAEFLPVYARGQCLMLVNYFWTGGSVLVTIFAYLTLGLGYSWRWFVFVCCIPCFLSAALCLGFVPESPRWLVLEGRRDEALRILQRAAKRNGRKEISDLFASDNMSLKKETPENSNYLELLKPRNRRMNLLLWGVWFAFGFSAYGTVLLITAVFESEGGDGSTQTSQDSATGPEFDYSAIAISALSESFGVFVALFTVDTWGRIKSQIASYSLAGVAGLFLCIASAFQNWAGREMVMTALAFCARAMELMACCVTWMTTAEVLKTEIRATGHSAANFAARMGSFFTAYVVEGNTTLFQISVAMVFVHALAVYCVSQLPETKGKALGYIHDHGVGASHSLTTVRGGGDLSKASRSSKVHVNKLAVHREGK